MNEPAQNPRPRRVLLIGAGPLPAAESRHAPGVANRLVHFARPLAAAGHECLMLPIEPAAPPLPRAAMESAAQPAVWADCRALPISIDDARGPSAPLIGLASAFVPDLIIGAGTLQAGDTACALAAALAGRGARPPVWVDLFGDPLAEIEAKADVLGDDFDPEEKLHVWRLLLRVLTRADQFSTVSRRQADALLGQLALVGRLECPIGPIADQIHPMPCSLESIGRNGPALDRAAMLSRFGLPLDTRVALWSGGFNAWADVETLVAGCELAMDRDPRLHLVATGGPLPGYLARVYERFVGLAAASRHAARIVRPGWLPMTEADAWLGIADIGLVIDRPCAETRLGARNRLLFHAGADCPMLATRGCEAVEELEAAGALAAIEPGNPGELARILADTLSDPLHARRLADNARRHCELHYTFAATTPSLLAFAARPRFTTAPLARAAEWIRFYLDVDLREREWRELGQYRGGRMARLKRLLGIN